MTTMRFGTTDVPPGLDEVIDRAGQLPPGRRWAVRFVGLADSEDCIADEHRPLGHVVADCARRLGFARAVICSSAGVAHAAVVVHADSTQVFYRSAPGAAWDSYLFDGHPPSFDPAFRPSLGLGVGRPRPQLAADGRPATDDGASPGFSGIRLPRVGLSAHPVFQPRRESDPTSR